MRFKKRKERRMLGNRAMRPIVKRSSGEERLTGQNYEKSNIQMNKKLKNTELTPHTIKDSKRVGLAQNSNISIPLNSSLNSTEGSGYDTNSILETNQLNDTTTSKKSMSPTQIPIKNSSHTDNILTNHTVGESCTDTLGGDSDTMLIQFSDDENDKTNFNKQTEANILLIEYSGRAIGEKPKKNRMPKKFYQVMSANVNVSNDNRPYALVRIFEMETKGLLDSGAQASIMNVTLAEQLEARGLKLRECDIFVTTADGSRHKVLGYMNVPYCLNGIKRKVSTLIVRQACVRLVLGYDFWKAFKIEPCMFESIDGKRVIKKFSSTQLDEQKQIMIESIETKDSMN